MALRYRGGRYSRGSHIHPINVKVREDCKLRQYLVPFIFTTLYSIIFYRTTGETYPRHPLDLDLYRNISFSFEASMTEESNHVDRDPSANGQLHIPLTILVIQPGPFDVLLGRGKGTQQHEGNQRFQAIINENKDLYNSFQSRDKKTSTTRDIVNVIKTSGEEIGSFLKFDNTIRKWVEVDDEVARVKVAQALRYKREENDADSKVSARKTRSERQHNTTFSGTTAESSIDPFSFSTGPRLAVDDEQLLSDGAILSALGYAEGSALEAEMSDQTEENDW